MENLKENIKEFNRIKKENYSIKEKIDNLVDQSTTLYHSNYEQFTANEKQIKQYKNKIELNKIKLAIIKNNLHYFLKMDFEGIKQKMIDIYETKTIGEKTREKMQNEIKAYYKENFNVNISCYISFDNFLENKCIVFTFSFLNDENYRSYELEYNEEFRINFEKRKCNNFELQVLYYNNIDHNINISDITKTAKDLQKEYTKTVEKIEKLRIQQKELYHNFTDYLQGFEHHICEIDTKLSIY